MVINVFISPGPVASLARLNQSAQDASNLASCARVCQLASSSLVRWTTDAEAARDDQVQLHELASLPFVQHLAGLQAHAGICMRDKRHRAHIAIWLRADIAEAPQHSPAPTRLS